MGTVLVARQAPAQVRCSVMLTGWGASVEDTEPWPPGAVCHSFNAISALGSLFAK